MARRHAKGREVKGILLLDKPSGIGSNEALQRVKQIYRASKAGHTGSLDRQASGLLPICLGEATKISGFLLNANKRYRSTFRLGISTTTGDVEGEVARTLPVPDVTLDQIEAVLDRFRGEVEQVPPMHSAIKHHGQRLYKLAHKGVVVERRPRTVRIHELKLLDFDREHLDVEVFCSKGTYIRTLAEDIGSVLDCGAHVAALRRIGSGPFTEHGMLKLDEIVALAREGIEALDRAILPMEAAVADWPEVNLPEGVAYYLRRGQPVMVPHAPTSGWVRIYGARSRFLGVGEVLDDGRIAPRRLVNPGGNSSPGSAA